MNFCEGQDNKSLEINVLNVASGPGRDMYEFLGDSHEEKVFFDCVEFDKDATVYAKRVCSDFLNRIKFINKNVVSYKTKKRYRLIWSAGLFDYFNDKGFIFLLRRLYRFLDEPGEIVIGNFSNNDLVEDYLNVMLDWNLNLRNENKLKSLANSIGINNNDIKVGNEPLGINLFLHIKRGSNFISL